MIERILKAGERVGYFYGDAKNMEALALVASLGPICVLSNPSEGRLRYELFSILQLEYLARKLGLEGRPTQ